MRLKVGKSEKIMIFIKNCLSSFLQILMFHSSLNLCQKVKKQQKENTWNIFWFFSKTPDFEALRRGQLLTSPVTTVVQDNRAFDFAMAVSHSARTVRIVTVRTHTRFLLNRLLKVTFCTVHGRLFWNLTEVSNHLCWNVSKKVRRVRTHNRIFEMVNFLTFVLSETQPMTSNFKMFHQSLPQWKYDKWLSLTCSIDSSHVFKTSNHKKVQY